MKAPFNIDFSSAFWTFSNFTWNVEKLAEEELSRTLEAIRSFEIRSIARQDSIQKIALEQYETDKAGTLEMLTKFSNDIYHEAVKMMAQTINP